MLKKLCYFSKNIIWFLGHIVSPIHSSLEFRASPRSTTARGASASSWKLRMSRGREIRVSHETFLAAPPPSRENFCEWLEVSRNAGDSNIPRKNLRSTFHFIRPNIVFLFLLIILSSTKLSEYISWLLPDDLQKICFGYIFFCAGHRFARKFCECAKIFVGHSYLPQCEWLEVSRNARSPPRARASEGCMEFQWWITQFSNEKFNTHNDLL